MPSSRAQASSNPILTNFAVGIAPEKRSLLAGIIAPPVQVASTIGHFKRYNDKNAFAVYETQRALGGAARRIEFAADDPTYNCKPQALEATIDDAERDAAGAEDPLLLEQAKTRVLVSNGALGHEKKVFDVIKAAKAATANKGDWTDEAIDPVAEIDGEIVAMVNDTGIMPNNIIFDLAAWQAFRLHPKVVARQPGAELIGLTTIQAAMLLINPAIRIQVGQTPYDTAKAGAAQANALITSNEVFIFYNSPTPDIYDPSFAKTFMGGRGGIESVRLYRDEGCRSDVLALDWSEDIQVTSTKLGKRITFQP